MTSVPIHLFNTLTKQKETFKPNIEGHVSMYHCGPTVYNYVHIGNLRAYVAADILRRTFELNGYDVAQVMNITDIGHLQHDEIDQGDDKMTLALRREGKELTRENMKELGLRYFDAFRADCRKLNILQANLYPFASDHVAEDIDFVEQLLDKGNAYAAEDGIYFDTTSLGGHYGRLGGISADDEKAESRIGEEEIAKSKKKNIRDFAVWKFNDALGYDTSFGKGFPGWHIECSVMSMKYLGAINDTDKNPNWQDFKTFDIHTGGIDHIPVHHNNEIAQTEAISGKILSNYWLHNAHLVFEGGKKMAKSGDGFITLQSLEEKGFSPLGIRYWMLNAGYRSPMVFSEGAINDADRSYRNLIARIAQIRLQAAHDPDTYIEEHSDALDIGTETEINAIKTLVNDDLNTSKLLAFVYEIINDTHSASNLDPFHKMHLIKKADTVLGLDLMNASKELVQKIVENSHIPLEITSLAEKRKAAREAKDWTTSDSIREQIDKLGYEIKDDAGVENGYIVTKKLI